MTKLLLVEDDRAIVENLSAVLKGEGFQIQSAPGQKAEIGRAHV